MAKLRNCPYCKGETELVEAGHGTFFLCGIWRKFALRCSKCGAQPFGMIEVSAQIDANGEVVVKQNRDEIFAKWNRRADNG